VRLQGAGCVGLGLGLLMLVGLSCWSTSPPAGRKPVVGHVVYLFGLRIGL